GRAIGHADGGVVLLRPVDAVGNLVIRRDMVELGRGLIIWGRPALAAIEGDAGPAIVPHDHPARIIGIDPERVRVGMRYGYLGEGATAVDGAHACTFSTQTVSASCVSAMICW